MNRRKIAVAGLTIVVIALAVIAATGMGSDFSGPVAESASTDRSSSSEDGAPYPDKYAEISFEIDTEAATADASDDSVSLTTRVTAEAVGYENLSYDDLRLCMYDEEGRVLHGETFGSIRAPPDGNFLEHWTLTSTVSERPQLVLVDQPALRDDSRVQITTAQWDDNRGEWSWNSSGFDTLPEHVNSIQDNFEFPRRNATGTCG